MLPWVGVWERVTGTSGDTGCSGCKKKLDVATYGTVVFLSMIRCKRALLRSRVIYLYIVVYLRQAPDTNENCIDTK